MQSRFWTNADNTEVEDISSILFRPLPSYYTQGFCGIYAAGILYEDGSTLEDYEVCSHIRPKEKGYYAGYFCCDTDKPENEFSMRNNNDLSYVEGMIDFAKEAGIIPLYVGMTTRPFKERIQDHHVIQPLVKLPWIGLRYWPFPLGTPKEYLMELEAIIIDKLKPPLNRTRPTTTPLFAPTSEDDKSAFAN